MENLYLRVDESDEKVAVHVHNLFSYSDSVKLSEMEYVLTQRFNFMPGNILSEDEMRKMVKVEERYRLRGIAYYPIENGMVVNELRRQIHNN